MLNLRALNLVRSSILLFSLSLLTACTAGHAEQVDFTSENPPLEVASEFRDAFNAQIVRGTVRNISNTEIENVEAVVEFLSATDRVLDIKIERLGRLAPNEAREFTARHLTQYRAINVTRHRLRLRSGDYNRILPYRDLSGNQPPQPESGSGIGINYHYADPGGRHPLPPVTGDKSPRGGSHGSH